MRTIRRRGSHRWATSSRHNERLRRLYMKYQNLNHVGMAVLCICCVVPLVPSVLPVRSPHNAVSRPVPCSIDLVISTRNTITHCSRRQSHSFLGIELRTYVEYDGK